MAYDATRRDRTTQDTVLRLFAERLGQIPDMNTQSVVVDEQPIPRIFPGGGMSLVVCPGDGRFQIGSAHDRNWTEDAIVIVGIFILNRRDRPGRAESRILNTFSLSYWKRRVMAYLACETPSDGESCKPWEPVINVSGSQIPILRNVPTPVYASAPADVAGHPSWIGMQIHYRVVFDWDLYDIN